MNAIAFPPVGSEVALCHFNPSNYLKDYQLLFDNYSNTFSIEEKLMLFVLDRDGYFYSFSKPDPNFLHQLWVFGIYIQGFSIFNENKNFYSCFLKSFVKDNPNFKPNFIFRNL